MRLLPNVLAAVLALAPLCADAADLVVWWEEGYTSQEDEAVREIIATFEEETGKEVELSFYSDSGLPEAIAAAVAAHRPPDFAFGLILTEYIPKWALEDRLVDLSNAVGSFASMFDPDALAVAMLTNGRTNQRSLYALPMGRSTNHIHVWKSLLEQAGFALEDIPKEWDAFWGFWCDQVQPAVRQVMKRQDIWGVGLPMSEDNYDTWFQFFQFLVAYDANYVSADGRLIVDRPAERRKLIEVVDRYTAFHQKGCTPPDAVAWTQTSNNQLFHAQSVVMTANETLSIVNALKHESPDDYYENTATIEWPLSSHGEPFPSAGAVFSAVVFGNSDNVADAEQLVRFLAGEGWLMHYLNFSAERMLPPIAALADQPFWLDPGDPHRMAAAIYLVSRPLAHDFAAYADEWHVWAKAIHRVAADGVSPEQAVDEAIARIKQSMSE